MKLENNQELKTGALSLRGAIKSFEFYIVKVLLHEVWLKQICLKSPERTVPMAFYQKMLKKFKAVGAQMSEKQLGMQQTIIKLRAELELSERNNYNL